MFCVYTFNLPWLFYKHGRCFLASLFFYIPHLSALLYKNEQFIPVAFSCIIYIFPRDSISRPTLVLSCSVFQYSSSPATHEHICFLSDRLFTSLTILLCYVYACFLSTPFPCIQFPAVFYVHAWSTHVSFPFFHIFQLYSMRTDFTLLSHLFYVSLLNNVLRVNISTLFIIPSV
jgi:hypothetical protein